MDIIKHEDMIPGIWYNLLDDDNWMIRFKEYEPELKRINFDWLIMPKRIYKTKKGKDYIDSCFDFALADMKEVAKYIKIKEVYPEIY